MKLKTKSPYVKPKPGDLRIVKRFAWLPKHVEDKIIWLEHYDELQKMVEKPVVKWIGKYPILCPWDWHHVSYHLRTKY